MIAIGDKVVCVDGAASSATPSYWNPAGLPEVGKVYCITAMRIHPKMGNLGIQIAGVPTIKKRNGTEGFWHASRFRKLEDYRNQQELEYLRQQPQPATAARQPSSL